jgi:hypothetical protein
LFGRFSDAHRRGVLSLRFRIRLSGSQQPVRRTCPVYGRRAGQGRGARGTAYEVREAG